jgi:hypothetical protein
MKKPSKKKKKELRTLLARPDNEIDLTDIPELSIGAGRLSGNFYRPKCEWQHIQPRIARVKRRKR